MQTEDLSFSYKPRLMGPSYEFQLSKDALDWAVGARSGRVSYPMIKHIRLGYKPTNMGTGRFIAEIWPINAPKLTMNSVSARTLVDTQDLSQEYSNFLRELHRRIVAAKGECVFEAGMPVWRWWPSAILGVIASAAVIYIVFKSLIGAQFMIAGLIGFIGIWFMWQIWNIVMRNRPRFYSPEAIPDDVLPVRR